MSEAHPGSDVGVDAKASEAALRTIEAELRQSEQKFASVFRKSPAAMLVAQASDGRLLDVNAAYMQLTGYSYDELIGRTTVELGIVRPEFRTELVASAAQADVTTKIETTLVTKSGATIQVIGRADRVDLDGVPCLIGTILDITERSYTEETMSRLAAIVETSSDAIVSTRFDGTILSWNKSAEQMYGYRATDVIGQNLFGILAPGQKVGLPQFIERIRRGESIRLPDLIWMTPDQRRVDMAVTLSPIPDQSGNWVGIASVAHDITERKRLEDALRASEARLRAVIENTNDMIWSVDREYRLLVANAACIESTQREYGFAIELGKSVLDTVYPSAVWEFWQPLYDQALTGETARFEIESTSRPGVFVECYLTPIRNLDGSITGVAGHTVDLTDRLQAEVQIRETAQRLHLAADAAGIGVWNWNFADNTLEWDDRMCELYGVPKSIRDSVIYYDVWRSSLLPDDLVYAETTLNEAVRVGSPWQIFFRIVLPGGAIRHIQTSSVIDYDRKGKPRRMIGINRDVTEQMTYAQYLQDANAELEQRVAERTTELRNLVAELERANAGKDAFFAAVSHELRTPLTGILGMAETLGDEIRGPLNDHQKRYVAAITESGERLLHMVSSVLRYVAAMAADAPTALDLCRMAELCAVGLKNARGAANAKQQVIEMEVEPFDLEIRSDADMILQLIEVLLDNAIKFSTRQEHLGIRVRKGQPNGTFQLIVWDTGIGISAEQKPYLFKPLTQVDQRLARTYEGIGLGLALAKRIVDLLGGTIEVESELGGGSAFIVTLPTHMP